MDQLGLKAIWMQMRGLARECQGRVTGNARIIAVGRLERALGRIAAAHARANRQLDSHFKSWNARHGAFFTARSRRFELGR